MDADAVSVSVMSAHPLDAADREQTFADSHAADEIHGPRLDDHQPYPNFR
jgi:hypothetical protein